MIVVFYSSDQNEGRFGSIGENEGRVCTIGQNDGILLGTTEYLISL